MRHFLLILLIFLPSLSFAQDFIPFNGVVQDLSGRPIKGVRVWNKDKTRYTTSDSKGRFGLSDVQAEDSIHVRIKKMIYAIAVDGKRSMKIIAADRSVNGYEDQELINLGYGYVSRRENSGSSSRISGDELVKSGKFDLLECLRGRVAGLQVSNNNQPGDEQAVTIRGISTFKLTTKPLYIVDGVEVSDLRYISPSDVDYVEVLKDASIYGSRGANGAILVTTKNNRKK